MTFCAIIIIVSTIINLVFAALIISTEFGSELHPVITFGIVPIIAALITDEHFDGYHTGNIFPSIAVATGTFMLSLLVIIIIGAACDDNPKDSAADNLTDTSCDDTSSGRQ